MSSACRYTRQHASLGTCGLGTQLAWTNRRPRSGFGRVGQRNDKKRVMSLTGSSVLSGGCLGIPILAPHGAGEGEAKRLANGLCRGCWSGWLRGRGGGRSRAMTMHSTGRMGGRSPPSSHLPGGGWRPAHQARHVHQHHHSPPLPLPRPSNRSRWPILLLRRVA